MKAGLKVLIGLVMAGGLAASYVPVRTMVRRDRQRKHLALLQQMRQKALADKLAAAKTSASQQPVLRVEHPQSLEDEKALKGRTLWVRAGGEMEFYAFNGKGVDFSHQAGVLLGAEKILVKDALEQAAPKSSGSRFPDADALVLVVFTRPADSKNPTREYAVAVGDREGHDYNIVTDQTFYYDDPHQIYAAWGADVWKAIDAHTAKLGMTEQQLQLALGQSITPRGDIMGDRDVEFTNQGKPTLITFVNGKAVQIRDESQ